MREIKYRVFHCTGTKYTYDLGLKEIKELHTAPKDKKIMFGGVLLNGKGWRDCGYHIIVRLDGSLEFGRNFDVTGAHVSGHNWNSLGIVYVGGLDTMDRPYDTRTYAQLQALKYVNDMLKHIYPDSQARGHRDFSPDLDGDGIITPDEFIKQCPCFDAIPEYD